VRPTPRARRFAETFAALGREHGKPALEDLAVQIYENFVQQGREMTTPDENAALNAAAATFRTPMEVNREDHRRARTASSEQTPSDRKGLAGG
jgi:hypothetical protein